MRTYETIVLHCSATPPTMLIGVDTINRWHIERGWAMCGYHFVVKRDGTVERGRPVWRAGAHARGHNQNTIGVCMIGGVDYDGKPEKNFEMAQYKAVRNLVAQLRAVFGNMNVIGHRDLPNVAKACPSFCVQNHFTEKWCRGENT